MHSPLTFRYEQPQSFEPDFWQVLQRFSNVGLGVVYHAGCNGWTAIKPDGSCDTFTTRRAAAIWLAGLDEPSD